MADIQRVDPNRPRQQAAQPVAQQPETTTVTGATEAAQFYAADVPALGGEPLIVECRSVEAAQSIYRRECKGLDAGAQITVRPASDKEVARATEEQRLAK